MSGRRAAFLDRDGVLNRPIVRDGRSYAPRSLDDFEVYPEAPTAVARLRALGFLTVLVTNQKDVGAGLVPMSLVDAMHVELTRHVDLDAIKVCTCVDECPCYKPNPGMLAEAASELKIDLSRSVMIGDRWRDVGAGRAAGCKTIFIDRSYEEELTDSPDFMALDIADAVRIVETHLVNPALA